MSLRKHPLAQCENCPLREAAYVPSKLIEDGTHVVIAEAPAHNEVKLGEPLVGQSGKLLNATFRNLGGDPNKIHKLNAVSCFCEPGSPPSAKAIECCKPRLQAELDQTTGPLLVLGNSAVRALFGAKSKPPISKLRGTNETYNGRDVVFTYHPAATFRSPNLLRVFEGDIRNLLSEANKLSIDDIKYVYYESESALLKLYDWMQTIPNNTLMAYDIETNWKQWYEDGARVTSLALSPSSYESHVINGKLLYNKHVQAHLANFFNRMKMIAHNAKFDQTYLQSIGIAFDTSYDTMLQSNVLNEYKQNHGLKELANQYLGIGAYKHIAQTNQTLYNAIDTATTRAIFDVQQNLIEKDNTSYVADMLMQYHWLISRVEFHGIKLNLSELCLLEAELVSELVSLKQQLAQFVMEQLKHIDIASMPAPNEDWIKDNTHYRNTVAKTIFEFNPSSSRQMQILIHDILKLKIVGEWPKGEKPRSTSEKVLLILEKHSILKQILNYRKHEKILKTYIKNFIARSDRRGYFHPDFIIGGTETGRLSARDGIHSLPRNSTTLGRKLRSTLICEEDEIIIAGDYSQAELRIFAVEANVKFLLKAYQEGKDVHNEVVELLRNDLMSRLNLDINDDRKRQQARVLAKGFNFGSIYGGGVEALAAATGIPKEVLAPIYDRYHKEMPEIRLYAMLQMQKVYQQGYVVSRFGRKRRFYNISSHNKSDIQKEAANAPTQGAASDITMHAAIRLQQEGFQVIHLMHDGIYAVVKREESVIKAQRMQQIMVETAEYWYPEVPWKADISIGTSFADLKEKV